MTYTNSSLISGKMLSPNYYTGRRCINRIIPHCYVGQVTAERACRGFANPKAYDIVKYRSGIFSEPEEKILFVPAWMMELLTLLIMQSTQ